MAGKRISFDAGPLPGGTLFCEPLRIIRAQEPADVAGAFEEIRKAQADGQWVAGYASYELGYMFSNRLVGLMPPKRDLPLMLFGVFAAPEPNALRQAPAGAGLGRLEPALTPEEYAGVFAKVQDYIAAGDIYQVNLTFAMTGRFDAPPEDIYATLRARQPVGHGALVDLGGPVILSRSPELFLSVDADGVIETRPMKGTAPRGNTAGEDETRRAWLANSQKNRAENLMIVDLLRNDISRVASIGSVEVPELFKIESYATVHQMTSVVRGQLRKGIGPQDIFRALFPCGSITGAPKIRAMQIISELETGPRGVYCGAIGWIAPDGRMAFNVAIRTLVLQPSGQVMLNVGGGIIHDSTAAGEYEEALLKARFAELRI